MSFLQDMFDPGTSAYNAKVKAANRRAMTLAMTRNVQYKNKGVAFKAAKQGAVVDQSIANSNVRSQALQNQYAAFQGFESFARAGAAKAGPSGQGSATAERGRTADYMALLAKRQDIEHGLKESFGATYAGALHQNAVRKQNSQMAARDKLGLPPQRLYMQGTKGTNWGNVAFGVAKLGASIYLGGMTTAAGGGAGKWDLGKGLASGLGGL